MGVGLSFDWNYHGMADLSQDVYYTLDGSEPSSASLRYEEPLELPLGGHIRARAIVAKRMGTISESRTGILRTGWTAHDSEGRTEEAMRVLNGNTRSRWISGEAAPGTHSLTIDMKQDYPGFRTDLPAKSCRWVYRIIMWR
jgi:alpha-L-fucosidase